MKNPPNGHSSKATSFLREFGLELAVYALLVGLYVVLILETLDVPLARLYHENRAGYAVLSVVLILAQGWGLEWLTATLVRFFRPRR